MAKKRKAKRVSLPRPTMAPEWVVRNAFRRWKAANDALAIVIFGDSKEARERRASISYDWHAVAPRYLERKRG